MAPFRDDAECRRWLRYLEAPDRGRRMLIFAEAYRLTPHPGLLEQLVDGVIAQRRTVAARSHRLAPARHQPQQDWMRDGHAEVLASRIAWSEAYRHLMRAH